MTAAGLDLTALMLSRTQFASIVSLRIVVPAFTSGFAVFGTRCEDGFVSLVGSFGDGEAEHADAG